ncbi:hypothetical protein [Gottschalkia purinilytica]|nr:hypothetical protein [Gottschalkia purinilytica]
METSNSRKDCLQMPLADLIEYYEDLANEVERKNKEYEKSIKGVNY